MKTRFLSFIFLLVSFATCAQENNMTANKVDTVNYVSADSLFKTTSFPFLFDNKNQYKIYIEDHQIEDTLKIAFRVCVYFDSDLSDTTTVFHVKSVELIDMTVRSVSQPKLISSLSNVIPIRAPKEQHLWNLCKERVVLWYKNPPYSELSSFVFNEYRDRIYMTGVLYVVPCKL
jgi:hypothetical protein